MKSRNTIKIIAVAFAVLSCGICDSALADGNEMLTQCQSVIRFLDDRDVKDEDVSGLSYCLGFVHGLQNVLLIWSVSPDNFFDLCFPEKAIDNGQKVRIFVKYLTEHPERLHEDEVFLFIAAMESAFPCVDESE